MGDFPEIDYTRFDRPEILAHLFHPRWDGSPATGAEMFIPVGGDVCVGAELHLCDRSAPNILFFHGNGEIAADYDDIGALYNRQGINFLAVDYRGYGRSSGKPTVSGMIKDSRAIFEFTRNWLEAHHYTGRFFLMGRSLGSASALELASGFPDRVEGLIIESGFAFTTPLLTLLGIDVAATGISEADGFGHLEKIKRFCKPTLIIHAEYDHIIPFSDGQALYDACGSPHKSLLKIPGADHNDIFMRGLSPYLEAVRTMVIPEGPRGPAGA